MKIISVVGARPNFMKIGPFIRAIHTYNNQLTNWSIAEIPTWRDNNRIQVEAQQKSRPEGTTSIEQPVTSNQQPVTSNQQPVTSNEQQVEAQQKSCFSGTTSIEQPATSEQQQIEAQRKSRPGGTTNNKQQIEPSEIPQGGTLKHLLVHTGQHYDDRMSKAFFESLGIPEADINLGIGSGTHAQQVGNTMIAFEKVCMEEQPDWVVVVGDVNATLACSVTAKKLGIKVCHIEAGLRSGDMTMPEEINRLVTDRLSDLLLIPDKLSGQNLRNEGVEEYKIGFVGNIMIDTLEANREKASSIKLEDFFKNNIAEGCPLPETVPAENSYAVMTLHRPSNVDEREVLEPLMNFLLEEVSNDHSLIWPIHPRARKQLVTFGLWEKVKNHPGIILLEPIGYHEMLRLNMGARIMLTDSGGLQEECCVLGTPCLTLRWNTERPVTLREHGGASVLVGNNVNRIREEYHATLQLNRTPARPELWDGRTAERCVEAIVGHRPESEEATW